MDNRKERIVRASVEWIDMKLSPLCSEASRERWREMIAATVMAALVAFEEQLASEPKAIQLFCPHCMGWLRAKEKHAGREMRCPFCGKWVKVQLNRN